MRDVSDSTFESTNKDNKIAKTTINTMDVVVTNPADAGSPSTATNSTKSDISSIITRI